MRESSETKAERFVQAGLGEELVTLTVSLKAKTIVTLNKMAKSGNMPLRQVFERLVSKRGED